MKTIIRLLCWPVVLLAFLFLVIVRAVELAWNKDNEHTTECLVWLTYALLLKTYKEEGGL